MAKTCVGSVLLQAVWQPQQSRQQPVWLWWLCCVHVLGFQSAFVMECNFQCWILVPKQKSKLLFTWNRNVLQMSKMFDAHVPDSVLSTFTHRFLFDVFCTFLLPKWSVLARPSWAIFLVVCISFIDLYVTYVFFLPRGPAEIQIGRQQMIGAPSVFPKGSSSMLQWPLYRTVLCDKEIGRLAVWRTKTLFKITSFHSEYNL